MATQQSLNRRLKDSLGKTLFKEDVRILAKMNARASGEMIDLDTMNERDMIQWATDADGRYDDDQVAKRGMVYRH